MKKRKAEVLKDCSIIPAELAIRAMRDSGYRNTAHALAELIDNSVQARARTVEVMCLERTIQQNQRQVRRVYSIGVLDSGTGMDSEVLRLALQFGNGTHLSDRSGIGRFGMGLPNASISQGKRVDVWTWQSGPDNAIHSYLDVEEIESGEMKNVPEPDAQPVPDDWRMKGTSFSTTGSLVVWTKLDEQRLTWKGARATLENTESIVGRMYRKFISRGILKILLRAFDEGNLVWEYVARPNDPMYLLAPSSTPEPFNDAPMFEMWGERDQTFQITQYGKVHTVTVKASWAKPETVPEDGTDRGSKPFGKHAARNIGVSIVRADRELALDSSWAIGYEPTERWWGVEVDFPPDLDEVFGVTNNKQAATVFSHMAYFDWKTEAEPGESFVDYTRRLRAEKDPRANLLEIADYIRTILPNIRNALRDQTKGRRGGGRRHDETGVEDRATTKFNERAKTGHTVESDTQVFDPQAKEALVNDLVDAKKYPQPTAVQIADAIERRNRKVIFVEAASEMDAFFSVEQKPGGITEVVFNANHPAFTYLVKTLDADISDATSSDLVERIQNASETLKMLFAAWSRQEVEDMPGREKLRRMRQDWGRMARDFLTDDILE